MQMATGEWRWFSGREVVFKTTADGLPQQILGITQDITDRKQAEAALQNSEERLRMALGIVKKQVLQVFHSLNLVR